MSNKSPKTNSNSVSNAFGEIKRIEISQSFQEVFAHGNHAVPNPTFNWPLSCPPAMPILNPTPDATGHCFHWCTS